MGNSYDFDDSRCQNCDAHTVEQCNACRAAQKRASGKEEDAEEEEKD